MEYLERLVFTVRRGAVNTGDRYAPGFIGATAFAVSTQCQVFEM